MKRIIYSLMCIISVYCQNNLNGIVRNSNYSALEGAAIYIKELKVGSYSDSEGRFQFDLKKGSYTVEIQLYGYKRLSLKIVVPTFNTVQEFLLSEDVYVQNTVEIIGKSQAEILREQSFNIDVIDVKAIKNINADINQIIKTAAGVNIREEGGLGSGFKLSLNGLSGNQVRTFINGVPMDYFGSSMTLNNFPANLIDNIEIYKGVVPVHLSSDALGGAINIVTNKAPISFFDLSLSHGSFNTNRLSISSQYHQEETGFTVRGKLFYNASDNNYNIDVEIPNERGKLTGEVTTVERFHDAYDSQMGQVELGITGQSYADELMIGYLYSQNYKEYQQASSGGRSVSPYGGVFQENENHIFNFNVSKKHFLTKGLNFAAFIVHGKIESYSVDTVSHQYKWDGEFHKNAHPTIGEIGRKSIFLLNDKNLLVNSNVDYQFSENQLVTLNFSMNRLTRKGEDKLHARNSTQFSEPSTTNKKNLGLSYSLTANENNVKSSLFIKKYFYTLKSLETNWSGNERNTFQKNIDKMGYGFASAYHFNATFQLKTSFEKTIRYPEPSELFGNGLLVLPNPSLNPEESKNYNIGFRLSSGDLYHHSMKTELNGFLRNSDGFIRTEAQGVTSVHVNQASVRTTGIDAMFQYTYKMRYRFGLNATFQNLRNTNTFINGRNGQADPLKGDRVPNIPYFFGNIQLGYTLDNAFMDADKFSASISGRYVQKYFLNWPLLAARGKSIIPSQFTVNTETTYTFHNGTYNLSLSVNNLLNAKVYDNFNLQKPGRSLNFKLRYFILN